MVMSSFIQNFSLYALNAQLLQFSAVQLRLQCSLMDLQILSSFLFTSFNDSSLFEINSATTYIIIRNSVDARIIMNDA